MTWSREQLMQWMRRIEARASGANAYDLLEVHPGATSIELHGAFYRMAENAHPDLHRDLPESDRARLIKCFGRVSAAYATLRSPDQRQRHDTSNPMRRTIPPTLRSSSSGSGIITIPPPTTGPGAATIPPAINAPAGRPPTMPPTASAARSPTAPPGSSATAKPPTLPPSVTRPPVANPANTAAARAMIYFRKGEAALRQGDTGAALFNLRLAQAADPSSAEIAELLATVMRGGQGGPSGRSE